MDETGPASAGVAHINQHSKEHFQGVLECQWTEHKGRILRATRDIPLGELILTESPLHIAQEAKRINAFKKLKQLCTENGDSFDYEPLWYWCALQSLTKDQLKGAKATGLVGATPEAQYKLLLLHHEPVTEPCSASDLLVKHLVPSADPILVARLIQIWVLNCFEYSDNPVGYSTYFLSSFMSHSCLPNAVWYYSGADHVLRARRPIKAGDEVCISYLPEHGLLQSAPVRRQELHTTKRFWCGCERCAGEKDLSRGLSCSKCKGTIFARTPTGPAQDEEATLLPSQFVGQSCISCGLAVTKQHAKTLSSHEKRLKTTVAQLTKKAEAQDVSISEEEIANIEEFIDTHFVQHALSDLAWEQLTERYAAKGRRADQLRLLDRRVEFHVEAYPGLCGARAWVMEAAGDARASGKLQEGDVAKARKLYSDAYEILSTMFGPEHEYVMSVVQKFVDLTGEGVEALTAGRTAAS